MTVLRNYLNVASNERARPKVMFARQRERSAPRKRVDGLRVASASPFTVTDVVPAAFPLPSTVANNRPYWYHNDHLGTPQAMTDQAGLVVWKGNYQPFGEVTTPVEDVVNPFRFPGQYEDGETGGYYNWYRIYSSSIARYIQADPLGIMADLAMYGYAFSNAMRFVDVTGLKTFDCKKPLDALGRSSGRRSGPDVVGNKLYHRFTCIIVNRKIECFGQCSKGDKAWGEGEPCNDEFRDEWCDEIRPDDQCYEECLQEYNAKPRPKYGLFLPWTNCQEWAADIQQYCRWRCD